LSDRIEWAYFAKRRNIDLLELIKSGQCNSYEELCNICERYNVIPPSKSEWQIQEAQAFPKIKTPEPIEKSEKTIEEPVSKTLSNSKKKKK